MQLRVSGCIGWRLPGVAMKSLADDLVQETVAVGIAKRKQLRDHNKVFAWLYTILSNKWRRYLQQKKLLYDTLDDQLPSHDFGPSAQCQELELVARVRHVVATLPMKERQVISLVDLEELTYCDVGKALDIPIGTVMSRLHRTRKHFMAKIDCTTSTRLVREPS